MLNKLLQRQINKHLGDIEHLPEQYQNLFQVISESYDHFEKDRKMLERSIDLSSTEMIALNNQLRKEIQDLEKAKKEAKESEANLNAIINNTEDSIFSVDRNYKILSANQCFIEKVRNFIDVELKPGDCLFHDQMPQKRVREWKEYIDRALQGQHFKMEMCTPFKDFLMYTEVSFNPIREKDEIIGVGCFSRDVTKEKLNAEKIKASETRFRSLIENSQDMLSLMDAEGIGEYISPSIERTFGYTLEESKGMNTVELLHPDDLPAAAELYKQVLENPGVPIPYHVRNRKKDGEYLWVEGTLTNLLHISGINAIVGNFRDVTE